MKRLTEKQRNILTFIAEFCRREGMSPTVYEIGEHFGIKTSTVFIHLRALQRKNFLTRSSKARSIKLLQGTDTARDARPGIGTSFVSVPFLDVLTPKSVENPGKFRSSLLAVSPELLTKGRSGVVFAFAVADDSMHDFGIQNGDIAFAAPPEGAPSPGEVVLAYASDRHCLGGFFPRPDGEIELRTTHPGFPPRVFAPGEFRILGVVIALQRKL